MEGETKKRGREEGEEKKGWFAMKTLKQEMFYHNDQQQQEEDCYNSDHQQEESDESHISSDGKYVGLGVFDFPWLHENEGMISKSDEEYWNFQDTFSCSLDERQCLYETPTTTPIKLEPEEMNVWPLEGEEMESVDCIWSWMVNHPLQQPHH